MPGPGCQADPTAQDVHRGLSGVVVLAQLAAFDHADDGLAQHPFMTADDGVGGRPPPVGRVPEKLRLMRSGPI